MIRTCRASGRQFSIADKDLAFYGRLGAPPPTLSPDERQRRRLAHRNERNLYWRKSDGTGKKILSVFSEDKLRVIYEPQYWFSDSWSTFDYGREFDFSRPFFPQFNELLQSAPELSCSVESSQNCDYVNHCGWSKDCYLVCESDRNERCMFSSHITDNIDCLDVLYARKCELCYECVDCRSCYELLFSQNCQNCNTSWCLKNCIGCTNCIGCINLRHKEYCIFNEQHSKDEYLQILSTLKLDRHSSLIELREKFRDFIGDHPVKYMEGAQNENSSGDYLLNTQRCDSCFDVWDSQDCAFVYYGYGLKNVYDLTYWGEAGTELCLEVQCVGQGVQNVMFTQQAWGSSYNLAYCNLCVNNSHDLFGCASMKKAQYCILNKQYSKSEYLALREKIIEHMKATGEWGEFYPIEDSPFAYNETVAQEFYPLTKEEVLKRGWKWRDDDKAESQAATLTKLPARITEVPDSITGELIPCEITSKTYRIQQAELHFYRKLNLPIPTICPEQRHRRRMALRNPRKLHNGNCSKCGSALATTHSSQRSAIVYCEQCYLAEVN